MNSFWIDDAEFSPADCSSERLDIQSSGSSYEVEFLSTGRTVGQAVAQSFKDVTHPIAVIDRRVAESHMAGAQDLERGTYLLVDVDEDLKSLEGITNILDFFVSAHVAKDTTVFAIGGGIVQDAVGFACGIYKRGIPWIYVPTTLLAQADSCIGAKTGINFRDTKNLIGIFASPQRVLADAGFLSTLRPDDLLSGLGEVFKLFVIAGSESLSTLERCLEPAIVGDRDTLQLLIAMALSIKQPVIEFDEFDAGPRRALNFGHTIGHALEVLSEHELAHGLAVSFGVLVESAISRERDLLSQHDLDRLFQTAAVLLPAEVVARISKVAPNSLLGVMARDKKVQNNTLKLPLPIALGRMRFVDFALNESSAPVLESAFETVLSRL